MNFYRGNPFKKKIYIMAPNENSLVSGSARGENSLSIVYVYFMYYDVCAACLPEQFST